MVNIVNLRRRYRGAGSRFLGLYRGLSFISIYIGHHAIIIRYR